MTDEIVILGAARTPLGSFLGDLRALAAPQLGGAAIRAALDRSGVEPQRVDEVLMGCVLPAGQGQAPARQAALNAGLPKSVPCTTVNKMCGSGMKTVMMAFDQLMAGNGEAIIAGGMESMSNAPYLLPKMRYGARLGHAQAVDHMFIDGLEDAYEQGRLMGQFAEECAEKYQFSRAAQDQYALGSLNAAREAQQSGRFDAEIVAVAVSSAKAQTEIRLDEQPLRASPEKIPLLKPAFKPDGTVTPANSSSISDGAAALVLARQPGSRKRSHAPLARVLAHASYAHEPGWFTTAPIHAIESLLAKVGWSVGQVDLWEINEAFAVVPMAAMTELGIPRERVNVNGGACALGHPIGASGARIIVTLLHALRARGLRRGVAALCIGGGEATALALELCD